MRKLLAACALLTAVLAWDVRYSMIPDGLSYLDLASDVLRYGPMSLVDGQYWGPLYPLLIAILMFIFRPAPSLEFPLLHLLNWLLFVAGAFGLRFLLGGWLRLRGITATDGPGSLRYRALVFFSFSVLFWSCVQLITLLVVTPDLCVAAIVFWAAGVCCRISGPTASWKHCVLLGALLALGCYAKSPMFPISVMLLAILFAWPPSEVVGRRGVALAAGVFAVAASPLVILVSRQVGHLSFGEAARLNYVWHVNKLTPYAGWTGPAGIHGAPVHPPRTLVERPRVLEFSYPIRGTYPLWYNPCYWYEGAKPRFDLKQQLRVWSYNLLIDEATIRDLSVLLAGVLALWLLIPKNRAAVKSKRGSWWVLLWPLAVCGMYASVHLEYRYVGAFAVLFWVGLYGTLMGRAGARAQAAVLATAACALLLPLLAGWCMAARRAVRDVVHPVPPDDLVIAEGLGKLGIRPGDRLASVGYSMDLYYARLAGARIVAEVPDAEAFWQASAADLARVRQELARIGVKAIMARETPPEPARAGWLDLPGTRLRHASVFLLPPPAP